MKGQWLGSYTGSSNGLIMFNVDEYPSYYKGVVYLNEDNSELPNVVASFKTKDKNNNFQFQTDLILPINPQTGVHDLWDNVKNFYPNATISEYADVKGSWNTSSLNLTWTTQNGVKGTCILPRSKANESSMLVTVEAACCGIIRSFSMAMNSPIDK